MKLALPDFILQFFGDSYLHKYPFWFIYKPHLHRVKGYEIRQILNEVQSGDILLTRHAGYLSSIFGPGYWGHAGIYVGENIMVEATGKGVKTIDILDFCRADGLTLLRTKLSYTQQEAAARKATSLAQMGLEYDYEFESGDNEYYCTELVDYSYDNLFNSDYVAKYGHFVIEPDAMYKSNKVDQILTFKH